MTRRTTWTVIATVLALVVAGALAWRLKGAAAPSAGPTSAAPSASAPVALDLAPGDVLTIRRVDLVRTLAVSGGLKAVDSAMVKAKVAGELLKLTVREGDAVKAGQVIGQIDPSDNRSRLEQAEQNAASAQAQLDIAERTLKNNQALVDQNFISRNALDTSISNAAAARASLRAAQAAVDLANKALGDAVLTSPISGLVSQRLMQPGERAALDARVVEVVDLSRLELEAAITPEDVAELRVGQTARLQIDGRGEPIAATVARISPTTQAGTRAVMAYLSVPGRNGLRQGLFTNGVIELTRRPVLAVPAGVVRVDQSEPYVLVLAQGKVVQRNVKTGAQGLASFDQGTPVAAVDVTQGLAEGDTVLRGLVGAVRTGTPARLAPR
jgi:membrane fusion protein, multidrug efflux system